MEVFSLIGILVLIFVVLSLEKILSHGIKFMFYAALALFVVVYVFGISYNDLIAWFVKIFLWAF